MIRLTSTKLTQGSESVVNDDLNTMTVTPDLVNEPQKFFQLIHSIAG